MMRFLVVAVSFLLPSFSAIAQVATGTYAFGAFDNHGFDSVNVGNLNVHFGVPVINKSGRGLPFYYNLSYDSSVWYPSSVSGSKTWTPAADYGWRGGTEMALGYLSYSAGSGNSPCPYQTSSQWVYHDATGVAHSFAGVASAYYRTFESSCPQSTSFSSSASDGSGYVINVPSPSSYGINATLTSRSGAVINAPISSSGSGTVIDANGNQVSMDANGNFTDTTGQVVLKVAGNTSSAQTFTYTDTTGASRAVTVNYKAYTVQTNFGCSGIGESGPLSTSLVDTIVMPDGNSPSKTVYSFTYEPTPGVSGTVTGRPASVTLPGGGIIGYTYTGANNGIVCADGSAAGLTRTMLSDSPNTAWTYTRTPGAGTSHTDVVDGLNNHLSYDFVAATVPSGAQQLGAYLYETNRKAWNGAASGTAILAKATCYNGSSTPCTTTALNLPVAQLDTYQSLDGGGLSGSTAKYNTYGGPTETDAYTFGSSSSRGSLLSKETIGYGACGPANLISSDVVVDWSNNTLSSKSYCYDETAVTATSNLPSHVAAPGSRGNLTTSSQWLNTTSSNVSSTYTYDDTGQVLTAVDRRNNSTSYTYDTATNAFPLKTTYPTPSSNAVITTGTQYDAMTGALFNSTDPNAQVTSVKTYDALLRPTEIDYPGGGIAKFAYNSPTEVQVSRLRTGANYIVSIADADGYGRQLTTTLKDANDGDALVTYTYDGNGNTATVTNPHRSSASGSDGTTTYAYDVLGRQTGLTHPDSSARSWAYSGNTVVVKDEGGSQWKQTRDGLGRLTQVLEPSSTSKSPTLETDYGYSGLVLTVTQRGVAGQETAQVRTFTSDTLGRTVTAVTPEAGTVCYGAWSNGAVNSGTCQNGYDGNGNLLMKTDARNIAHTFQYDTLNRVTNEGASDNTISNVYVYDNTGGGSFGKGLLYGLFGKSSVAFLYDQMGRVSSKAYSLPSMNGNWAQAFGATYDLAGDLATLTYPDGRVVTQGWNNAGHLSTSTFTAYGGTNMNYPYLASATYLPTGSPAAMTFGNNATQSYGMNSRLQPAETSVQINANGLNQKVLDKLFCYGPPAPGPPGGPGCADYGLANNGNIQGINDPLNTNRLQGFAYDPLNRMTGFGTGDQSYSQTYSYDSFGNMNQVAPGTLQSNLSFTSKNQIGNTSFVYDAAGNLTQTSIAAGINQTMSYDAAGRLLNFNNGVGRYTYDAEGNRARKDTSSDWREYLYFNGAVYAEKNSDGSWSDYIYANGQRIARDDNFDPRIHTHGTTPGNQCAGWSLPLPAYSAKSGDVLVWRQYQSGGAYGGPNLQFQNAQTHEVARDTAGVLMDVMQTQNAWVSRVARLDAYAGQQLTGLGLVADPSSPSSTYDIYYGEMAIVRTDGSVIPIYTRQTSGTLPNTWNTGYSSNLSAAMESGQNAGTAPQYETTYYHGDHLGSARMLTSAEGWPMSATTFYPFGVEEPGASDMNHFRYASLERDAESNLDAATFRQYAAAQGRWVTPDPYDGSYDTSNPQSFNRYSYVLNNPMTWTDALGLDYGYDCGYNCVGVVADEPADFDLLDGPGRTGGGGGGGGGGGSSTSAPAPAPNSIAAKICGVIPTGAVASISANGNFVGTAGSLDAVTNFRTGETTGFFSPGYFAGAATLGASVTSGFTFGNLGAGNSNFAGGFSAVSAGAGFLTGSIATSSGGPASLTSGIHPFGAGSVTVVSGGVQTPGRALSVNSTFSLPLGGLGKLLSAVANLANPLLIAANQACAAAGH